MSLFQTLQRNMFFECIKFKKDLYKVTPIHYLFSFYLYYNFCFLISFSIFAISHCNKLYVLPLVVIGAEILQSKFILGTKQTSSLLGHEYVLAGNAGCMNLTFKSCSSLSITRTTPNQSCSSYCKEQSKTS